MIRQRLGEAVGQHGPSRLGNEREAVNGGRWRSGRLSEFFLTLYRSRVRARVAPVNTPRPTMMTAVTATA